MMNDDRASRHSWVKLRLHVYLCRRCGTAYENRQLTTGDWRRMYFLSPGENKYLDRVPICATGKRTDAALRKYADAL